MQKPRILVAVPYHRAKLYSLKHLLSRVEELTFENKTVLMRWDLKEYGGQNNVKIQREYFRRIALAGTYTHLYFFGVDTIPPKDVLERLLSHDKAIVGGVYWGRHNADNGNIDGAVAWKHDKTQEEQKNMFLSMNKLIEVDGMGMDCVLFRIDVLEKISWLDWVQNDDDYPYYDRAKKEGYKTFLDTNVQCRHYFSENGYSYLAKKY